jgi:hypothetical protein
MEGQNRRRSRGGQGGGFACKSELSGLRFHRRTRASATFGGGGKTRARSLLQRFKLQTETPSSWLNCWALRSLALYLRLRGDSDCGFWHWSDESIAARRSRPSCCHFSLFKKEKVPAPVAKSDTVGTRGEVDFRFQGPSS